MASAAAATGAFLDVEARAQGRAVVNLQLGWLLSGNQIGEVCAKQLGYYEQEGVELRFQAGGPSIDGVAVVAAGRFEVGQVSSSPSLMLAASQDLPIRCFAAGAQEHPFSYISRAGKPVREPRDLIGKKVGTQSTAVILLRAMLARHNIPENQVQVIPMGADMSPLMTGQVDVVTGWLTNTTRDEGDPRSRGACGCGTPACGSTPCPTMRRPRRSSAAPRCWRSSCAPREGLGLCACQPRRGDGDAGQGIPEPQPRR